MANPAEDLQKDPLLQTAPSCEGFKVLEPAVLYAKIGAGGMGAVYRGRHFSLECDVAVKVLKPDLAHDEQFVARFAREAKLAARISNDNVVRVLDVKEKNGIHYLVMEFVKGETARERVKRKGPLKEAEALAVVFGAAMGLRDAHQQGIVHRDIKPDNVLVSAEGAIKLADLGLAKQKQAPGEQNLTVLASGVMGTPQYMPPEQWRTPDVTPAADVWALGATLFYLLAGHSGIPAGEMLVIAEHVRDHDFPNILTVRPDVRPEVAALIAKCTQRKPEQRFADARELVKALRPLVAIDDELLKDPDAGSGNANLALVTPPPRATLARIKLQVEQDPDDVATRPGGMPGGARPPAGAGAEPGPDEKATVVGAGATAAATAASSAATVEPVVSKHRAAAWIVLGVLLAATGGGYAAGWFGPSPQQPLATGVKAQVPAQPGSDPSAGGSAIEVPTKPTTEPQAATNSGQPADPALAAKAALARGLEALPRAAGLDTAIEQFELALRLDSSLVQAKQNLVLAQVRKSKQLVATDPDAAYEAARRAVGVAPDDTSAKEVLAAATAALQKRLAASVSVRVPTEQAVLGEATFRVEGAVGAPNVRSVRVALVAGDGNSTSPFPRAQATAAPVVGGAFEASVRAAGDGPHQVRVEVEHTGGPTAEMAPRAVVVDTQAPQVTIERPTEDASVGALVEVVVAVVDASATTVVVAGKRAQRNADGAFTARVPLADGAQQLAVVATDAAGHETRVTRRLRVDAMPPVVTIAAGLPAFTNQPQLRIRGAVADAGGGTATLTVAGAAVAVNADGSFEAVVPIAEARENELPVVARDAAGNESAPAVVRVRHDNTPPVLAWPPQDAALLAGEVALGGTVADASPCEVQVNGTAATVTEGRWTAIVRLDVDTDFVAKVTARDAAGNEAEPLQRTLRAERPFTKLAWAVPAPGARRVAIGQEAYPSVAVDVGTGIRMVLVPAAPEGFTMGSPAGEAERGDDETAHRRVIGKPFWLGETEVTQAQWQAAMGNNPSHQQGEGLPVDSVSWDDCQAFVMKLNGGAAGGGFRLPSEAEWEYACRAGSDAPFAFGAAISAEQVNFDGSRPYAGSGKSQNRRQVLPAHSLPANAFGLFDMHGNVYEWCEDLYATYPGTGTEEPARGDGKRVVRGGAWASMASGCRCAFRFSQDRWTKNERVGLRLARSLDPQ